MRLIFLFLLAFSSGCSLLVGRNARSLATGDAYILLKPGLNMFMFRFCPHAKQALIVAAKKHLTVNLFNMDLDNKPEWYTGGVILRHNEKNITKALNIISYLEEEYPNNPVLPKDPSLRTTEEANALNLMAEIMKTLEDPLKHPEHEARVYIRSVLANIEDKLTRTYFSGSQPAYTDYIVFPFIEKLWIHANIKGFNGLSVSRFPDQKSYPKLTEWFEKMQNLPEVMEATIPFEFSLKFWSSRLNGKPNVNVGVIEKK